MGEDTIRKYSSCGTLEQNGVVERRNITLMDMIRSMVSNSILLFSCRANRCVYLRQDSNQNGTRDTL